MQNILFAPIGRRNAWRRAKTPFVPDAAWRSKSEALVAALEGAPSDSQDAGEVNAPVVSRQCGESPGRALAPDAALYSLPIAGLSCPP
jgi:hypothetical protein